MISGPVRTWVKGFKNLGVINENLRIISISAEVKYPYALYAVWIFSLLLSEHKWSYMKFCDYGSTEFTLNTVDWNSTFHGLSIEPVCVILLLVILCMAHIQECDKTVS